MLPGRLCLYYCVFSVIAGIPCSGLGQSAEDTRLGSAPAAAITPDGQIIYYIPAPADIISAKELQAKFGSAVQEDLGMKDFIIENPDAYLAAGRGPIMYGLTLDKIREQDFKADLLWQIPGTLTAGATPTEFDKLLETEPFLNRLANNLFQHAKELSCGMPTPPQNVQGSVSIGIVGFNAARDFEALCE
jgi:hypothetical protein